MVTAFSLGGGLVYAIDPHGVLWWYRHEDWMAGGVTWSDRQKVGEGWNTNGFSVIANSVDLSLTGNI